MATNVPSAMATSAGYIASLLTIVPFLTISPIVILRTTPHRGPLGCTLKEQMAHVQAQLERKFWGWGYEGEGLSDAEIEQLGNEMQARFGVQPRNTVAPPSLASLTISEPRLRPPESLAAICSQDRRDRAVHTLGKSYDDLVRGIRGDYRNAP